MASVVSEQSEDGKTARGAWGGKIEFILTCVGYAVGLGNVWRFPYLAYRNGGGAFLIPYFIMMVIIGIPLFYLELCWAQFASLGPMAIWQINPLMKGLGVSMLITQLMITLYFNVIISWCIYYLFASMTSQLPWESCGNDWNTPYCMETKNYANLTDNITLANNETVARAQLNSPSEEYFYNQVLKMSTDIAHAGTIVWELALCLLLAWIIVFSVLIKGIRSLGKVVYFTSIFPYVLLTIMLVRGVTLEGAWYGIKFYLYPDWNRLRDAGVWSAAATQIFYSLGTGTGSLLAMASYNKFRNNALRDSLTVPFINCFTSFYSGFVIFSVLGYMAKMKGVSVDSVAADGPGLMFVIYPEGLVTMPIAPLWSILFFCMMLCLGLSSMFSMAECFFCGVMDEFPNILRKNTFVSVTFRAAACACFYIISLPMITNAGFYVFSIFDTYTGGFPLLVISFFEILSVVHVYGYKNFLDDIRLMMGRRPRIIEITFLVFWLVVTPLIVLALIIFASVRYTQPRLFSGRYKFSPLGEGIGWTLVSVCLVGTPLVFLYVYCKHGAAKLLWTESRPTAEWGPAKASNRTGRYARDGTDGPNRDEAASPKNKTNKKGLDNSLENVVFINKNELPKVAVNKPTADFNKNRLEDRLAEDGDISRAVRNKDNNVTNKDGQYNMKDLICDGKTGLPGADDEFKYSSF